MPSTSTNMGRPKMYFTTDEKRRARAIDAKRCFYAKKNMTLEDVAARKKIKLDATLIKNELKATKLNARRLREQEKQARIERKRERQLEKINEMEHKKKKVHQVKKIMIAINNLKIDELTALNNTIYELSSSAFTSDDDNNSLSD